MHIHHNYWSIFIAFPFKTHRFVEHLLSMERNVDAIQWFCFSWNSVKSTLWLGLIKQAFAAKMSIIFLFRFSSLFFSYLWDNYRTLLVTVLFIRTDRLSCINIRVIIIIIIINTNFSLLDVADWNSFSNVAWLLAYRTWQKKKGKIKI